MGCLGLGSGGPLLDELGVAPCWTGSSGLFQLAPQGTAEPSSDAGGTSGKADLRKGKTSRQTEEEGKKRMPTSTGNNLN